MEYTIYNESLVYYALRNPKNGYYYSTNAVSMGSSLKDCTMFTLRSDAEDVRKHRPDFSEIRKVKVIDIGEVNENI